MKDWKSILISPNTSLRDAMAKIDASATKVALVVDEENHLLGTLTDGDIRRALLTGIVLSDSVDDCKFNDPTVALVSETRDAILSKMRKEFLHQIPVVDDKGRVVDLKLIEDYLVVPERKIWVVIMAGGLGTRLNELTRETPKPMLPVGDRPLLETIVCRLVEQGFRHLWLSVNYHAGKIEDHFGDGTEFGAEIHYLKEDKRLGTAGPLSLLPYVPPEPIIVTNADVLSNIDYAELMYSHFASEAEATMAVRNYEYQIPYGVVRALEGKILELQEKPVYQVTVNAGVYVLSQAALTLVPKETCFDMTELFETFMIAGLKVCSHQLQGYWLDIGRHEDFLRANQDYTSVFK